MSFGNFDKCLLTRGLTAFISKYCWTSEVHATVIQNIVILKIPVVEFQVMKIVLSKGHGIGCLTVVAAPEKCTWPKSGAFYVNGLCLIHVDIMSRSWTWSKKLQLILAIKLNLACILFNLLVVNALCVVSNILSNCKQFVLVSNGLVSIWKSAIIMLFSISINAQREGTHSKMENGEIYWLLWRVVYNGEK